LRLPRRWLLWIALGLALRLAFIWFPRPGDDDTLDYLALGHNLLHHGVYGLGSGGDIAPTLFRLPAYPIFLAAFEALFARFWPNSWWNAVFLAQIVADLAAGLLLADFACRHLGSRAAEIALVLAMLCPFTAAEAGIAMTECLSIFAVALGIFAGGRVLAAETSGGRDLTALLLAGLASALAMLLRPDGVLLYAALASGIFFYILRARAAQPPRRTLRRALSVISIFSLAALLPLVPWTIRNYAQFHVVQPLAPRYLNDPGEHVNTGFYHWLRTWSVEYVTTATVFWNVGSDNIDPADIPPSACDSPQERAQTLALIAEYNRTNSISASLDQRFAALAERRIHAHPFRYYAVLPVERVADMLFRPRTEAFYLEVFWWQFGDHPAQSAWAILIGLVNFFYVAAAAWAFLRRRVPWPWMLGGYLILRCLLLGTMENPEPRYTLECFPIFIVAAAAGLARTRSPAAWPAPLAPLSRPTVRQSFSD
jgi:4-amino-4-deoxy-L-arabinose transferase-like glycosyltransferase